MKLKSDFVIHLIGDEYVVVPVGARTNEFSGMIKLNETGAFLWKQMEKEFTKESLVKDMLETYDVSAETAKSAVDAFVDKLTKAKFIEE